MTEETKMLLTTKDDILGLDDLGFIEVHVKTWDRNVRIRMITAAERDNYQEQVITNPGREDQGLRIKGSTALIVALCLVDENNKRLFTSTDDIKRLGRKSSAALEEIAEAALEFNAMKDDSVDELEENLE